MKKLTNITRVDKLPIAKNTFRLYILSGSQRDKRIFMDAEAYAQVAEMQFKHWWFEGRRRILGSVISRLGLPQNSEILEAGCGAGANIEMLKHFGTVYGFEPYDFMRELSNKIPAVEIADGLLPDKIPFGKQFDLVCAFDVIEHVEKDAESLKSLCEVTKPGGYAVFTVPAYMFMWSKHDEMNHHFRRYTAKTFKAALENSGYRIEKISYYNTLLFPAAFCVRMLKSTLKSDYKDDLRMPSPACMNTLLTEVFSFERHLLKHLSLPFGLSIIAVCKKP